MTAPNSRERIVPRLIEEELQQSFINYSMSVIVSRALPDVRDGLKPVHRRILYAMNELGLLPNRAFKKSATVVGDVLGKYHPHGDQSVYDALVRMVQTFSLRYPLVDGQGNFGSVDGDPAAAYRYTESRLTRIALEMLADIDKNTVDFIPNFDDQREEPSVLPSRLPNLLVNGSSGIAVGMATNIPPHNLREIARAIAELARNPDATTDDLLKHVKGPDFPTGAYIYGEAGIREAYETGRGRVIMRARVKIEENERTGKSALIITEIPYQVNKATLHTNIAELAMAKRVEGISGVRDESDRDGMRLVVELKRDAIAQVVLNGLYKHTAMQSTFGVINLALVNGAPKVMPLKEMLQHFITHRHTIIVRRTEFDLAEAKKREHILEGLKIAVDNIDEVIKIIRASADTPTADAALRKRFGFSEAQADAILNMRLAKLTGLEIDKLEAELAEVRTTIAELESILASREKRTGDPGRRGQRARHHLRRRPPHRDPQGPGRILRRGPDRRRGHGDHHLPYRLHQADSGHDLPAPAPRRPRPDRDGDQGAGLGRAPLHRVDPRLPDVLLRPRHRVLAQGARDSAGRPRGARQAGRQLHQHPRGRTRRGTGAGPQVRRRRVADVRHPQRDRQEDGDVGLRQRAQHRHQRHQHRCRRRTDRRAEDPRQRRHRAGHVVRHEHPVPRDRCPRDGARHFAASRASNSTRATR